MRSPLGLPFWLILAVLSTRAVAVDNCFVCVLGIWEDEALTNNVGQIVPNQPKDLFVGIKFAAAYDGLTGIEFSIAGLRPEDGVQALNVEPIVATIAVIGSAPAPGDTSMSSRETGGMAVAWSSCLAGSRALVKITIFIAQPVVNKLLVVKRRYPTSDPQEWKTPVFTQCDIPLYTATRVRGGSYILNWNGDPRVPISKDTWAGVKLLFR